MHKETQQQVEQQCLKLIQDKVRNNKVIWVGFDHEYQKEITQQILNLTQNPIEKVFPDYIGPKYIFEHFRITSAGENRKGAKIQRKLADINREVEAEMAANADDTHTIIRNDPMPPHTYVNYQQSIIRNCESHLNALHKYTEPYECVGFVLHYTDFALFFDSDDTILFHDDKTYRLSKDTMTLSQLLLYKEKIDFIIFVTNDSVEILNLKNLQSPYVPESVVYVRARETGHMTMHIKDKIGPLSLKRFKLF